MVWPMRSASAITEWARSGKKASCIWGERSKQLGVVESPSFTMLTWNVVANQCHLGNRWCREERRAYEWLFAAPRILPCSSPDNSRRSSSVMTRIAAQLVKMISINLFTNKWQFSMVAINNLGRQTLLPCWRSNCISLCKFRNISFFLHHLFEGY